MRAELISFIEHHIANPKAEDILSSIEHFCAYNLHAKAQNVTNLWFGTLQLGLGLSFQEGSYIADGKHRFRNLVWNLTAKFIFEGHH